MSSESNGDTIQVFIRIRPNPVNERERESPVKCVESSKNTITVFPGNNVFTFDKVFNESATQEDVFSSLGKGITQNCMNGYNSTIFAYGQTGSGKTYTIQGASNKGSNRFEDANRGLAPRILQSLFSMIQREETGSISENSTTKFLVKCSLLEIYNEQASDLFAPNSPNLSM